MAEKQQQARGLQVEEDRAWQEKFWTAQRIAWVLMALFIFAALVGFTGKGGAFASATAQTPAGMIEYPRITRWQSDELLTVKLPSAASGEVQLELSNSFVELFAVQSIKPEPSKAVATATGHRFTFDVERGGGPKLIQFQIQAENPALLQPMTAMIGTSQPAQMTVTVLP